MIEEKTGKVEIDDFEAETVDAMVYYMYKENIYDERLINVDLLRLADKYNVTSLVDFCAEHLEENLSLENALDILVTSHQINQKDLFYAATNFAYENMRYLVKTDSWKKLMETDPKLANDVVMKMLNLQ